MKKLILSALVIAMMASISVTAFAASSPYTMENEGDAPDIPVSAKYVEC